MVKEQLVIPLFRTFIKETRNGKRRKSNGDIIKPETVNNYDFVFKLLLEYEQQTKSLIKIKINLRHNRKELIQGKRIIV